MSVSRLELVQSIFDAAMEIVDHNVGRMNRELTAKHSL